MRFDITLLMVAMVIVGSTPISSAHAQTGASQPLSGAPIAGVCMLSREAIFANAKIGKAASARLKQLSDQAQAQLEGERKPVDADVQAFRSQAASLSPDQRQTREQALSQRVQTMQAHVAVVTKQIEATRVKALARIAQEAQPVINSVYQSKGCGLLLDRNVVLGGNMSNDLTATVVQGLDAKMTTISFDLEAPPAGNKTSSSP
jgi:Skp family chaperone for outer membrane proteins